jgi:hypothetical protein
MNNRLTWGLFAAWAVHDAEEWLTIGRWSARRAAMQRQGRRGPRLPQISDARMRTGIAVLAPIVAATALHGARTGGRSRLFQAAVAGFGLHGFGHLAASAAMRGYTPGVATAPIVVIPFGAWAWHRRGREGIRRPAVATARDGIVAVAAALVLGHGGAAAIRYGNRHF